MQTYEERRAQERAAIVRLIKLMIAGFTAAIILALVIAGIEKVDAGETCAVTWFGDLNGTEGPGLHFRIPVAEQFHCYSSRQIIYEAAANADDSDADYADPQVDTQTSDGQEIQVPYRISFRVPERNVGFVYENVAVSMDQVVSRVVTTHSRPLVRQVGRNYSATELYGGATYELLDDGSIQRIEVLEDKVPELEQQVFDLLKPIFEQNGVELLSIRIGKPEFESDYVNAIEAKQIAFENIQTERNNAAAAAQQARAEEERAKGEAAAIRARGEALADNPMVLQLEFVESLGDSTVYLPSDTLDMFIPAPEGR